MTHGRGRRRRSPFRKPAELAELELAYVQAWQQRAWDRSRHATPWGTCFGSTHAWRSWERRVREHLGHVNVVTVTWCEPIVAVFFHNPDGEWLSANLIDELVALAQQQCTT